MMGKAFVLAQPHCHGNPFLPKHNSGLSSVLVCLLHLHAAVLWADCLADVPLKHVTQLLSWLIYQGRPLIQANGWGPFIWGALRLVWAFIPTFGIMRKKLQVVILAHVGANCCALQKLGKNFWENWHDVFSIFFFFFFFFPNNNLQNTAVSYYYQQAVQWQRPLNSLGTSIQKCFEKAG